jgi:hypothetical protein
MTDRLSENVYIASNIKLMEAGINIAFDSTWIANLSSNKKIGVRRIVTEIDSEAWFPIRLEVDHNVLKGGYDVH